ncbi:UNVERIFIED_CONTAM: hypothetical protein GTU68_039375, partial [Idotea baltica]|nr:hypothetical protein [Idotea baltica]
RPSIESITPYTNTISSLVPQSYERDSYEFHYQVQDDSEELDFGHKEENSGGRVEGYYYVLLPDTRLQRVTYYVDGDSGFVADVSFEGSAEFDSYERYGKK